MPVKKKNQTNQIDGIDKIIKVQNQIKDRIEHIKQVISNINLQIANLELILKDIKDKIDNYDRKNKQITKSQLMRWYLEDIKIYNELHTIKIKYEELLSKYSDQLISSNVKIEDLKLKFAKLESDNQDIQMLFESLESKLKESLSQQQAEIKIANEVNDPQYKL